MSKHLKIITFLILSFFMLLMICGTPHAFAADSTGSSISSSSSRSAKWYEANYGTGPFGQTWMMGRFGPDIGIGEQGVRYQYTDPMSGSFVSYTSTGLGMGLGGPFAGYGGMFSPTALASYGPFAYGNNPQPMPTLGYSSQGYTSGSLFGPNTNYYSAQPAFLGLMGGLLGMGGYGLSGLYSGFGGLGLSGFGLGGFGGFGGSGLFGGGGFPFFGGFW